MPTPEVPFQINPVVRGPVDSPDRVREQQSAAFDRMLRESQDKLPKTAPTTPEAAAVASRD
jgi:hypothetical protein